MTQKYLVPRRPYSGKFSIINVIIMNIANPLLGRNYGAKALNNTRLFFTTPNVRHFTITKVSIFLWRLLRGPLSQVTKRDKGAV